MVVSPGVSAATAAMGRIGIKSYPASDGDGSPLALVKLESNARVSDNEALSVTHSGVQILGSLCSIQADCDPKAACL